MAWELGPNAGEVGLVGLYENRVYRGALEPEHGPRIVELLNGKAAAEDDATAIGQELLDAGYTYAEAMRLVAALHPVKER